MKKFIFLYKGFTQPTPEIGQAWMKWFEEVGDKMIDGGNPFSDGSEVTKTGVTALEMGMDALTGYSIISAESKEEAIALAKTNPMITSVVVYELAKM
jgi:DNA-binding XRE family transcriptional regulator